MDDAELENLLKKIKTQDLKAEAKKRGIALGKCPTKMGIAKKLPLDVVQKLAKE